MHIKWVKIDGSLLPSIIFSTHQSTIFFFLTPRFYTYILNPNANPNPAWHPAHNIHPFLLLWLPKLKLTTKVLKIMVSLDFTSLKKTLFVVKKGSHIFL